MYWELEEEHREKLYSFSQANAPILSAPDMWQALGLMIPWLITPSGLLLNSLITWSTLAGPEKNCYKSGQASALWEKQRAHFYTTAHCLYYFLDVVMINTILPWMLFGALGPIPLLSSCLIIYCPLFSFTHIMLHFPFFFICLWHHYHFSAPPSSLLHFSSLWPY